MGARLERSQVCFVLAPAYHGATLLSLLLNNHSKITALADTLPMWEPESRCSCGVGFRSCTFWQTVADRLCTQRYAHLPTILPAAPWPLDRAPGSSSAAAFVRRVEYRIWGAELRLAPCRIPVISARARRPLETFASTHQAFYELLRDLHGTSVVVDGTKRQEKFRTLKRCYSGHTDMSVIHLVRDPRGFARSWSTYTGGDVENGAREWRDFHAEVLRMAEIDRLMTVRYEDICASPEREIERIISFLSLESEDLVGPPRYPEKHHLVGNKMLMSFTGAICEDERWKTELSEREKQAVLRSVGELASRFGYS